MFDRTETRTEWNTQWKLRLEGYMDGVACSTFIFLVTLWALFGDDLRLLLTQKEADGYFVIAAIFCLIMFSIELGANTDLFGAIGRRWDSGGRANHVAVSRRPPNSSHSIVARTEGGLHVRCESVGVVPRSKAILCRPVPNPNIVRFATNTSL